MSRLAEIAGVHVSTVSRALRGDPAIPDATRLKLKALAAKLGYRPDPALTALLAYRRSVSVRRYEETIAVLASTPRWRENPAIKLYFEGATARARELGYKLEVFVIAPPKMSGPRIAQILSTRSIRGLLILPLPDQLTTLDFPWSEFSAVALGYKLTTPRLNRISVNHFEAMTDALRRLYDLGYRRPGLVLMDPGPAVARSLSRSGPARPEVALHPRQVNLLYEAGFAAEQKRLFAGRLPVCWLQSPAGLKRWLLKYQPDVVLSQSRDVAKMPGLPEGVAWVYTMVDGDPELPGINQNSEYVGRHAIDTLIETIYRHETGAPHVPTTTQVHTGWQEGIGAKKLAALVSRPPFPARTRGRRSSGLMG